MTSNRPLLVTRYRAACRAALEKRKQVAKALEDFEWAKARNSTIAGSYTHMVWWNLKKEEGICIGEVERYRVELMKG